MNALAAYFAYGSNMNPDRVTERGLAWSRCEAATLTNFVLRFNKVSSIHPDEAHANIEYQPGARVEGVLYDLEHPNEILKMDPFERAPWNYGRDAVCLSTEAGERWGWTYFANPAVIQPGLRPSSEYLAHLLAGSAYLSADYFRDLQAQPVATVER